MNAYEFGLKFFNEDFHPSPNCVIFNDKYKPISGDVSNNETDVDLPFYYEQVLPLGDNHYKRMADPRRLRAEAVEDYLSPNNYITTTTDNTIEGHPDNYFFNIYVYNDQYYVKAGDQAVLGEIVIKSTKGGIVSPKLFGLSEQKLKSIIEDDSISLIFFFSEDGAVLESGYSSITEVLPNEIIFFLEKDSLLNIMSVAKVKSGINIELDEKIPYSAIANLAQFFEVPIDNKKVETIFINHFEDKKPEESNGIFTFLFKIDDYVLDLAGKGLKVLIGDPLVTIGNSISTNLKADQKRWKYYNDDGSVNKDFEPVFPGLKSYLETQEEKEKENKSRNLSQDLTSIRTSITGAIDKVPNESYRVFLKHKLEFVFKITDKLEKLYDSFNQLISFKNAFIYLNALLIGIYNSLIEAIGGIISLVGNIINLPAKLSSIEGGDIKSALRIGAEMLENAFEAVLGMFSFKNIAAFFSGLGQIGKLLIDFLSSPDKIITKLADGVNYVATNSDSIGYGIGYAIGFIIEEVITAIATGGAKTVATAFKLTIDSFVSALSAGKKAVKFVVKSPVDFIRAVSVLFRKLKTLDVQKLMDEFIAWIKQLVRTTKGLALEQYNLIFNSSEKFWLKKFNLDPTDFINGVLMLCPVKK